MCDNSKVTAQMIRSIVFHVVENMSKYFLLGNVRKIFDKGILRFPQKLNKSAIYLPKQQNKV